LSRAEKRANARKIKGGSPVRITIRSGSRCRDDISPLGYYAKMSTEAATEQMLRSKQIPGH
jgi:hypothetical protein